MVAISVQYLLTGLVRGPIGEGFVDYTRYTYVAGIMGMVALGDLLGPVRLPAQGRARSASVTILTVWAGVALAHNGQLLVLGRDLFLERADLTRALVTVALAEELPPGVKMDRSLVLVPSPLSLRRIAESYGDPRSDTIVPFAVRPIPASILSEATRRLIEGAPIPH